LPVDKISTATFSKFLGLRTDTPAEKCPPDYSPDCSDMIFSVNGMSSRPPFLKQLVMPAEIVWREDFLAKDGTTQVLALDINGVLYAAQSGSPFVPIDKVAPGSKCNSVTAYGREYMAFFNDQGGCDAPRQWDGQNMYRVSQGGPGSAPSFTPVLIAGDSYDITSITQLDPGFPGQLGFFDGIELSAGPGSNAPGNVVTVYTANARAGHFPGGDPVLTNLFNSGVAVNVLVSNLPAQFAQYNGVHLVTSIGLGVPNFAGASAERWYFTFIVEESGSQNRGGSDAAISGQYQITQATITFATSVPGLIVGSLIPVSGTSVSGYNNSWPITQALNSGELDITQTSLTGGVGTYDYVVLSGVPPVAGQSIDIDGTLNANGAMDGDDRIIATATGGNSGSFTITGFDPSVTFPATAEDATGITAGSQFVFDPSAIYGDSTGGHITFAGNAASMSPGTYLAFPYFITKTGLTTQAGPIVKFTIPANTSAINFQNLVVGPANVVARGIAFTGANGGRYFTMPIVPRINGEILGTATVIYDNVTTSGTLNFTNDAILSGIAVDVPGNNLIQQIALNLPRGVNWYGDRMLWMGEANTVLGFLNMGMDGGTNPGSPFPAGWSAVGGLTVQQMGIMPVLSGSGTISQNAAQTAVGVAILAPNQRYALRAWLQNGVVSASLSSASTGFSTTLTLIGSGYLTANFGLKVPAIVPDDMTLSITLSGATARDFQMIYADNPARNPLARWSYVQNPEAYDALTGNGGPNDDATELRATAKLQESIYFITQRGPYSVQQIGTTEPSSWVFSNIAENCGAFDANSTVSGKGWFAWGGPEGFHWFSGGIPTEISAVILPTWRSFSGLSCVFNDSLSKRIYLGTIDAQGNKGIQVYDYQEVALGGSGKWCPWNRRLNWATKTSIGTTFTIGAEFYGLGSGPAISDEDLGLIGGYYTFGAVGVSMFRKAYSYFGIRISGSGTFTPLLYGTLAKPPVVLQAQDLAAAIDTVLEWPSNIQGRQLFLKVGQPGMRYTLEEATVIYQVNDPNAPISGQR
jgi:hypothetical protein